MNHLTTHKHRVSSIEYQESSIKNRVSSAQKESIMQNKPNLLNAQINVSVVITKYYENIPLSRGAENKPNSKPIQSQSNPISTPLRRKQTQTNPILNQSRPAVPQFLLFPFYFLLTSATREFRVFAQPQDCGADKDNSRIAL